MPYPQQLGQPCWDPEQVRKVISLTAHTSAESAPYFLAAHSPFERIIDAKSGGRQLTEEQVFQELFSPARGEIQAFVRGEPGTGKSHLIRWLKLRAEEAKARGENRFDNFKLVLVSRGNGSLKDALSQVVSQLGEEFERHTGRIRSAINKLSDHAARDTLLSELALEIGTHWASRHPEYPLPALLKPLASALSPATGFGAWMKRDGGVVHKIIQRLTAPSSVDDREESPSFTSGDLVLDNALSPNTNPGDVVIFADDLIERPGLSELVAKCLNMALRDAVQGLTGLRGSDLLDIFNDIRRDLGPQKQLAVFIEDVSVTGLDQEVVNAFEAREVGGLSRMVAVLGVTQAGWGRLDVNQKQRATFEFEVGGAVAESWANNGPAVSTFAARYLNAVRLGDEEIRALAAERFSGDVSSSACNGCGQKGKCFEAFGYAELSGGVQIGLFPFNPKAPKALLSSLSEARYQSQRGLLDRVLLPALDLSHDALQSKSFPQQNIFSVKPPVFRFDWTAFAALYLGGARWGEEDKKRARFLASYWVEAASVAEAASRLESMLEPLGLPKFSSEVVQPPAPPTVTPGGRTPPPPPPEDLALQRLLVAIGEWYDEKKLSQDADFRKLVAALLRNSIAWSDERGTPITVSKTGPQQLVSGFAFVKIEDQLSRPAAQPFFIDLDRSPDTKELLESLAHFDRRGRNWEFPHSELHKRRVSRWLRQNRRSVVKALSPDPASLASDSLNCAIQVLALVAYLRDRCEMPSSEVDRLDALFKPIWEANSKPSVLSSELQAIVSDLESKHAAIRSFVIREVGAGQGDAEPTDFIDPRRILKTLDEFTKAVAVEPPSAKVAGSFWKSRFQPISSMLAYADLSARLLKERKALEEVLAKVQNIIEGSGAKADSIPESIEACLAGFIDVIKLHQNPDVLPVPNPAFDNIWGRNLIQNPEIRKLWAASIAKGVEAVSQKDAAALLAFGPAKLKECAEVLQIAEKHLDFVEGHLKREEGEADPGGDARALLLAELEKIEKISESKEKKGAA